MKRHSNLWQQLVSFENIFLAFTKAVKGKGYKLYVLEFMKDFEHNILALQQSLINKSYQPGNYTAFFIYEPKKRMISAAPFADRIMHHCVINVIGPIFEATFVSRKIKDPDILWLINLIIDSSNPQEPVLDYFPGDDLLAPADRRRGLPIGNLTSQFFANVYLTGFDHFVKQQLDCRFYYRYVDDMVVVASDKNYLWNICYEMGCYLEGLRLRLHPYKQHVRPVDRGIRFLGQIIYPDRRLLPKKNIRRFMRRMKKFQKLYAEGVVAFEQVNHSFQSWLGHAKQAHTYSLRRSLLGKIKFRKN